MKELLDKYINNTYNANADDDPKDWSNYYDFKALKKDFKTIETPSEGLIVLHDDGFLNYAILEKSCSVEDESYGSLIYYGSGFSGNLREMRHTYFNPYLFYIPAKLIEESFKELRTYFDI